MKTPQFLLRRVYSDGNREEPQLYEINEIHADWKMGRRGFLLTTAVGVSALSCMTTPKTTKAASNAPEITGGCADEIKAHIGPVESVACSPDGKLLASGSSDKSIKLWEMPTGKLLKTLTGHKAGVYSVSFSPDGKLLASGSSDKSLLLWEMPTGTFLSCLFDPAALAQGKKVNQYTRTNQNGQVITYTLPCGSPIPAGAICTCNCVPGTLGYVAPLRSPSKKQGGWGTYCQCDTICTCIPIK